MATSSPTQTDYEFVALTGEEREQIVQAQLLQAERDYYSFLVSTPPNPEGTEHPQAQALREIAEYRKAKLAEVRKDNVE